MGFGTLLNYLCSETHNFSVLSCLKYLRGISIFGRHLFRVYAVSILHCFFFILYLEYVAIITKSYELLLNICRFR